MDNGFYWIEHNGEAKIAYYRDEKIEEIESGNIISGVWHVVGETDNIYFPDEVIVLDGALTPPTSYSGSCQTR